MTIEEEYLKLVENIKYYRKKQNMTQEKLAELSDLSSSYIKQIESSTYFKNISFYSLFKIAKVLNVQIADLFTPNIGNIKTKITEVNSK